MLVDSLQVSDQIELRNLSESDASEEYLAWMEDAKVMSMTEQRFVKHSLSSIAEFVAEKNKSATDILLGIFVDSKHVGNVKVGPINWNHKTAELSYFIGDRELWGRGIATRVVEAVTELAVDNLGIAKINAGYYASNIASAIVLERAGFELEGIRRSQVFFEGRRSSVFEVGLVTIHG